MYNSPLWDQQSSSVSLTEGIRNIFVPQKVFKEQSKQEADLPRQEVGSVSLQQNATQRDLADSIWNLCCLHVRDESSEAHVQVRKVLQEGLDHLVAAGEEVPGEQRDQRDQDQLFRRPQVDQVREEPRL